VKRRLAEKPSAKIMAGLITVRSSGGGEAQ
jgi:hypothetical protein